MKQALIRIKQFRLPAAADIPFRGNKQYRPRGERLISTLPASPARKTGGAAAKTNIVREGKPEGTGKNNIRRAHLSLQRRHFHIIRAAAWLYTCRYVSARAL